MTDRPVLDAGSLPGGVGVSLLRVYDTPTVDGLVGGSAHVHLACTEGYYVIGGRGQVQTLNAGGYRETALHPGAVVWFEPGTIHRLVNDGDLEILTLMQNGGLPEAGDAVLTMSPDVLADATSYRRATRIDGSDPSTALVRRDRAVAGFLALREAYATEGPAALEPFYRAAVTLVQPNLADWRQRWQSGARRLAEATGAQIDALAAGSIGHLLAAEVHEAASPTDLGRLGMCGRLDVYEPGTAVASPRQPTESDDQAGRGESGDHGPDILRPSSME